MSLRHLDDPIPKAPLMMRTARSSAARASTWLPALPSCQGCLSRLPRPSGRVHKPFRRWLALARKAPARRGNRRGIAVQSPSCSHGSLHWDVRDRRLSRRCGVRDPMHRGIRQGRQVEVERSRGWICGSPYSGDRFHTRPRRFECPLVCTLGAVRRTGIPNVSPTSLSRSAILGHRDHKPSRQCGGPAHKHLVRARIEQGVENVRPTRQTTARRADWRSIVLAPQYTADVFAMAQVVRDVQICLSVGLPTPFQLDCFAAES